ncbi:MAG TPA: hypothetical protein VGG03_25335 [Thermoanaerobaculia bacterium]|jgi:hypothetical protein
MAHDPAIRPKRSRDAIKAAYQVFQEVIGKAPTARIKKPTPQPSAKNQGLPKPKRSK